MIIDTNVNLSRWRFRRLIGDEPAELVARLRKRKVTQAWAGSFDGLFHKDLSSANSRLAKDCRAYGQGMLLPFGSINPQLPDWKEDLRRCKEEHRMAGIRLHPNYHGYSLQDPVFAEVLSLATAGGFIVQLALCMEDERTQNPLMRIPPVDLTPLADLVAREPKLRLVVLNSYLTLNLDLLKKLSSSGEVYFDFSMVERIEGVERLAQKVSFQKILFGSNYPLFYFESALLKVQESGLTEEQKKAVFEGNARRLVSKP